MKALPGDEVHSADGLWFIRDRNGVEHRCLRWEVIVQGKRVSRWYSREQARKAIRLAKTLRFVSAPTT